jgi:tRNA(Ile)-lysidine synthase
MHRLGPYADQPRLAVAVSGGADSLALALLTRDWAARRSCHVLGLVVDHGLRPESCAEADLTVARLAAAGIPARLLTLTTLARGPALAERARIMRYDVLSGACRDAGCRHLLLGHHAGDQIETVAMRVLRGSHTPGLAGMSAMRETHGLRLLRPLLGIAPASLKHFLTEAGVAWVEDPSNRDVRALRPRLRHLLADRMSPDARAALLQAIDSVGRARASEESDAVAELATRTTIRPEGFALLSPGRISEAALSRLLQMIGGNPYPPPIAQIADLAAEPRPATVAGVRMLPAGRLGTGLLIVREEAAITHPVIAAPDMVWDNRYHLIIRCTSFAGATIGALGPDAARFRSLSDLPSVVLRTLPALRFGKVVASVPHLAYVVNKDDVDMTALFTSGTTGPVFVPGN